MGAELEQTARPPNNRKDPRCPLGHRGPDVLNLKAVLTRYRSPCLDHRPSDCSHKNVPHYGETRTDTEGSVSASGVSEVATSLELSEVASTVCCWIISDKSGCVVGIINQNLCELGLQDAGAR